jgi:hypothetical protein
LWDLYRELGVTHVVWAERTSKGWDSIAGDLVFFDFALNRTIAQQRVSNHRIGRMKDERPTETKYGSVAFLGCGNTYATGLYELSQMTTPVFGPDRERFPQPLSPAAVEDIDPLLEQASFVVLDPDCPDDLAAKVSQSGFVLGASRKQINPGRRAKLRLYIRPSP